MDNPPEFTEGPNGSALIDLAGTGGDEVVVAHARGNRVRIVASFRGFNEVQQSLRASASEPNPVWLT
jgi:hypothetical protein